MRADQKQSNCISSRLLCQRSTRPRLRDTQMSRPVSQARAATRCTTRSRAASMKNAELVHLRCNPRDELRRARAGADNGHFLAGKIKRMIPLRGMKESLCCLNEQRPRQRKQVASCLVSAPRTGSPSSRFLSDHSYLPIQDLEPVW